MKTLALTLLAIGVMFGASAAEAAVRVKVGPVTVAAGRRVPYRHVQPVYVAPRPIPLARPAVVASAAANRYDTVHDIREERLDTFQDRIEERVDTVRDFREERRQAAWNWLQSIQP
jgi:hypothetical protein